MGGTVFTQVRSLDAPYPYVGLIIRAHGQVLPPDALNGENWTLTDAASASRLRTMEAAGIPLGEYVGKQIYYGIKTGFNTAFVIDSATRNALIYQDSRSAELIKPLAVGDDIRKWRIEPRDRWLIVTPIGVDIARYPAIFAHLQQWQPQLEKRWDKGKHWWELRACDYYPAFDKPRIIFPDIAKEPRFTYGPNGFYTNDTTFMIATDDFYLLGALNSGPVWNYLQQTAAVIGDAEQGGRMRLKRMYVERIPIPNAPASERAAIADLVQRCLDARGVGCGEWEVEIDARVARLYGL